MFTKTPYVHDLSPTGIIHVSLSQFKQSERRVGEADVQLLHMYNNCTKTQSNYLHAGFDSSSTNTSFVIYMYNIEASNYSEDKLLPNILNYTNTQIVDFPTIIKATVRKKLDLSLVGYGMNKFDIKHSSVLLLRFFTTSAFVALSPLLASLAPLLQLLARAPDSLPTAFHVIGVRA